MLSHGLPGALGAMAVAVAMAVPTALPGQSAELVGTWTLNPRASDFGMSQHMAASTLVFERADDVLVLARTATGMGQERTTRFDMPIDGQVHDAMGPGGTSDSRAEWDGDTLVLWVVAESNIGPLDVTERISVSEDGDTLTITRSVSVPGMGDMTQTLVFDRSAES